MWIEQREHYLAMSYEEVQAEYDAKKLAAKAKTEALGAESESEVHEDEDDAPYAIAGDESLQAISGVSHENIDMGSTPLAGSTREVEQGGEPDASQLDAELPDEDATQAIVPSDAPGATALTPVTPVEVPVAPAVSEATAQTPGTPLSDAPAADAPAGDGNAPAWAA